jgi:hypothetical protein
MAEAPEEEVAQELYGAGLDEFVALRDARQKELRKGGDRSAADAVKKLRKPTVPAWAVNQLSRQAPDDLEALLAAGEALRQAQLGGGGDAAAMRSAARDERAAVDTLVERARGLLSEAGRSTSDATLEDVRETLHAAAGDEQTRALVERGRLLEPRQAVGLGGGGFEAAFAAAGAGGKAGGKATGAKATGSKSAEPKRKKAGQAKKDDDGKKAAKDAEAERRREADERAERKRAAQEARERQKQARAALREAEKEARERDRALAAAERERDTAQKALDRAQKDLERAEREADAAHAEAKRRRSALEDAEGD